MFGIGFQELILIMIVAIIVLGPKRLPEAARTLGKFFREFKSAVDEVKESVSTDLTTIVQEEKPKKKTEELAEKSEIKEEHTDELEKSIEEEYKPKREKISFKEMKKDEQKESKETTTWPQKIQKNTKLR